MSDPEAAELALNPQVASTASCQGRRFKELRIFTCPHIDVSDYVNRGFLRHRRDQIRLFIESESVDTLCPRLVVLIQEGDGDGD